MSKAKSGSSCCDSGPPAFRVEALVSVDERGQMVLPKELRDRVGIQAGEKLALICWEREGQVCCITLVKAEALAGMLRDLLGPMVKELTA